MNTLLPCFYPTKVLFVDDDVLFLDQLLPRLSSVRATYDHFLCPKLFVEFINNSPANCFVHKYVRFVDPLAIEHYRHDANITNLHEIMQDNSRFEEISVVVIDYDMPMMSGLEASQKINNPHIKKILLTGIADEPIAVEAFHKGLIDAYVRKQDRHLKDKLNAHIYRLQKEYFQEVFAPLTQTLHTYHREIEHYPIFTKEYQQITDKFVLEHNIVEHYMYEGVGTKIMLDKQGQVFYLHWKNENDFHALKDETLPKALLKKLSTRKYLLNALDETTPSLTPAKKLPASEGFYYGWSQATKKLDNFQPYAAFREKR